MPDSIVALTAFQNGTLSQVVGVCRRRSSEVITEEQQPAMFSFVPAIAIERGRHLVAALQRDSTTTRRCMRNKLREFSPFLPWTRRRWNNLLQVALFRRVPATMRLATRAMGALLSVHGVFGMAAYSWSHASEGVGNTMALGARMGKSYKTRMGEPPVNAVGFGGQDCSSEFWRRGLAFIVYRQLPAIRWYVKRPVLVDVVAGLLAR